MQVELLNQDGSLKGKVDVNEEIFNTPYKEALIHQVVVAYQAAARAGTHQQKTRAEVSGGGAKPWKQKGSGRARAGTTRGPIWRKGGVTFAARPQDYSQKVNKKMYRGAIKSILAELLRSGRMKIVDSIEFAEPKTKLAINFLNAVKVDDALIIAADVNENMYLSLRNLYKVGLCDAYSLDPVSLLGFKNVIVTSAALREIEEVLG